MVKIIKVVKNGTIVMKNSSFKDFGERRQNANRTEFISRNIIKLRDRNDISTFPKYPETY